MSYVNDISIKLGEKDGKDLSFSEDVIGMNFHSHKNHLEEFHYFISQSTAF